MQNRVENTTVLHEVRSVRCSSACGIPSSCLTADLTTAASTSWASSREAHRGMMYSSSVRRVVCAAPQSSLLACLTPSSARAAAAVTLSISSSGPRPQQRRRYSSSKPSSPNDSPKGLPDGQVTVSPSQSTKTGEKRRRKIKDTASAAGKLPSVPSTQHVPHEALALSTFFSLHRPISVTQGFPRAVSDDAFAQIFASRSRSPKYTEVMSTLSRTVDELEQPMRSVNLNGRSAAQSSATVSHDDASSHEHMRKIDVQHPDGSESSIYVELNAMSGQFLPFRPPPLPLPETANAAEVGAAEGSAVESLEPQHRVYKAIFTLEETTDPDGQVRITAHSPTLVEEGSTPRTFLERMALRQLRREESVRGRADDGMLAISTLRRRKLRMKKKKYKKLMKRTRNERRKLDRL